MLASNKFYNVTLYSLVKFSNAYYGGIVQFRGDNTQFGLHTHDMCIV